MLKSIYICSDNSNYIHILSKEFKEFSFIKLIKVPWESYFKSQIYNIINCPSLLMVDLFEASIKDLYSEIIETHGKYGFPKYAVTSINFMNDSLKLGDRVKFEYQVILPLEKVIEFSNKIEEDLIYGVHTKMLFSYLNFNRKSCKKLKSLFQLILSKRKLI